MKCFYTEIEMLNSPVNRTEKGQTCGPEESGVGGTVR